MQMAEQEFPWDHKEQAIVVPLHEPDDDGPPAWMDEVPPEYGTEPQDDGELPGVVNPATWGNERAPLRRFIIPGWLVRGAAGLLSGQEGVGKSLLAQQMATCAAVDKSFLGLEIEQVPSVYITCEDSMDELRRRQESINASLGITMADLDGKLLLVSLQGEIGNEFATFDQAARIVPSKRYRQILKVVTDFNAGLVFLDNAAHFFTGNENARHDVAAFLSLIERLSITIDGAVVLLAHPNKAHAQGNTQGNEYSGSTGWSAHVRNRLFLDWSKEDGEGNPIDDDGRLLRKSKANYGKKGEEIHFVWHEWAFTTLGALPAETAGQIARASEDAALNEIFLRCLEKATSERRNTSANTAASNFAPRVFAKMTIARGVSDKQLEGAMNRLFHLELIRNDEKLWKRENRTWVIGIKQVQDCTNPRTNHAQSRAQSVPQTAQSYTTDPHTGPTPSTTYIGQDPDGPAQSMCVGDDDGPVDETELGEPPAWMDEAREHDPDWMDNPVLNRDFGKGE
jgi:RecA-family ATPase